ncbi:UNVERIFIED_CONTAM: hypothetical protein FKN15_044702 [Acipenser sinensis]
MCLILVLSGLFCSTLLWKLTQVNQYRAIFDTRQHTGMAVIAPGILLEGFAGAQTRGHCGTGVLLSPHLVDASGIAIA